MYGRIDEAVGISRGRVWEAFWNFLCNSHVGWEIREVNWARLGFWRGVCGTGAMTRYEVCRTIGLCGYLFSVFILKPPHSKGSKACT